MFAYVFETGSSGRDIFDNYEYFRMGAILTMSDVAPAVDAALRPLLGEKQAPTFRVHEWPEEDVAKIGSQAIDVIEGLGPWAFILTEIHKPYMAALKLVDVIFDPDENENVPGFWRSEELNRHFLCLTIDSAMSSATAKQFWESYLRDDMDGIMKSLDLVAKGLKATQAAPRIQEVVHQAFEFAHKNPGRFSRKRKGAQESTPSALAFAQLFEASRDFSAKVANGPGMLWERVEAEFDPAKLKMPFSNDNYGIRAASLLLLASQQEPKTRALKRFRDRVKTQTIDYFVSRRMSELIVHEHLSRHQREQAGKTEPLH
ncbi:hypothetical protein [Sinorhizobium fredii]|uniref:DUF3800 domain-containing protein n=1 Tax=Rhizobium fredii TaxID=380 RepID=A0A2A6M6N2_RHIFR|nr:hypothetical protein [Sinorhizobium fredii]PDT50464.1 hypothetical protein CO661_02275 [Sinorhizobium fredii]